jgi:hypothetical protein
MLPLALPLALIGLIAMFAFFAIVTPIFAVQGWRLNRRINRKLHVEGREIEWSNAIEYCDSDMHQLLLQMGKNDRYHTLWLVPLAKSEMEYFSVLPTYRDFEQDRRSTVEALLNVNGEKLELLVPLLQRSIRIKDSSRHLPQAMRQFKDSMRIIFAAQPQCPSALLIRLVA